MNNTTIGSRIHLRRIASMQSLQDLMQALQDTCRQAGLAEQSMQDFRVAVEEACVNIMHYAYSGLAIGAIDLDVSSSEVDGRPAIVCVLRDQGLRFNPLDRLPPDTSLASEERDIGGLGVMLMRQMSDRVLWTHSAAKGNCLTLIKYLQSPLLITPLTNLAS